jgi:flagellar motor component MotA
MIIEKSKSVNAEDYEVLIRKRGENDYASFCPQLNLMIKGTVHEEVRDQMKKKITEHIDQITENQDKTE